MLQYNVISRHSKENSNSILVYMYTLMIYTYKLAVGLFSRDISVVRVKGLGNLVSGWKLDSYKLYDRHSATNSHAIISSQWIRTYLFFIYYLCHMSSVNCQLIYWFFFVNADKSLIEFFFIWDKKSKLTKI